MLRWFNSMPQNSKGIEFVLPFQKEKSHDRGTLRKEVCLSYIRLAASDIASQ